MDWTRGWEGGVVMEGGGREAHPALNTAFEDVRGVGGESGGRNGKSVTWCFTPSQPLLLYQGDWKERSSRRGWRRGRRKSAGWCLSGCEGLSQHQFTLLSAPWPGLGIKVPSLGVNKSYSISFPCCLLHGLGWVSRCLLWM